MTTIKVEDHLRVFLELHGEAAWRAEVHRLAVAALKTGSAKQEAYWRDLTKGYDWLDWDLLKQQAQSGYTPSTENLIVEALKSQMPGIKSQAQYDAVAGAMEALRLLVNVLLDSPSHQRELDARTALDRALHAVQITTELTLKLEDSPEAASSSASQQFKEPPVQFGELDFQAQLMQELLLISSIEMLNAWYADTKDLRDKIKTQSLRNDLLDAIRAKRNSLPKV